MASGRPSLVLLLLIWLYLLKLSLAPPSSASPNHVGLQVPVLFLLCPPPHAPSPVSTQMAPNLVQPAAAQHCHPEVTVSREQIRLPPSQVYPPSGCPSQNLATPATQSLEQEPGSSLSPHCPSHPNSTTPQVLSTLHPPSFPPLVSSPTGAPSCSSAVGAVGVPHRPSPDGAFIPSCWESWLLKTHSCGLL